MVGGRTVEVDLALSQDDARNLASGGRASAGPGGKDNRNLYLVPAALSLPCTHSITVAPGRKACKLKASLKAPLKPILTHVRCQRTPGQHPAGSTTCFCLKIAVYQSVACKGSCWHSVFCAGGSSLSMLQGRGRKLVVWGAGQGGHNRGGVCRLDHHVCNR